MMKNVRQAATGAYAWVTQDRHKQKAVEIRDHVERAFTEHPQETGETYVQHLWFTFKMTTRMFYSSVVLLVHGLFPFMFTRTASKQIEKIYSIMRSRISQGRREEINKGNGI